MKQINIYQIKALCLIWAVNNDLKIETLDNETFLARGQGAIIHVPLSHLYTQVQNGFNVYDTLDNEACHDEETA